MKELDNELKAIRLIRRTTIFGSCSNDDIKRIAAVCQWKSFLRKKEIFSKGDPADGFYMISSGEVEIITNSDEGRQIILNVIRESDFFGEVALIDDEERAAAAVVAEDAELLYLPGREWKRLIREVDRECLISITLSLCRLFRHSNGRLEDAYFFDKRKRLLLLLARLCKENQKLSEAEQDITLIISQDKLAKMVGLTREFTNKILSHCERSGILSTGHGSITIHDSRYLLLYSEGEINEDKLFNMA